MKRKSIRHSCAWTLTLLSWTSPLWAASKSAIYSITADAFGSGAGSSQSAAYSSIGAFEAIHTASTGISTSYQNKSGSVPQIVGVAGIEVQWVFYNESAQDGNDPEANAADDAAIALDKTPLLRGRTASLANITTYDRGLNGIMIDLEDSAGAPSIQDFRFRMGKSQDLQTWVEAPTPKIVTFRKGAGVGGTDRVTLIWESNNHDGLLGPHEAITDQWLEVTLLSTAITDLPGPEVFYFGNVAPGSSDSLPLIHITDPLTEAIVSVQWLDAAHLRIRTDGSSDLRLQFTQDIQNQAWEDVPVTPTPAVEQGPITLEWIVPVDPAVKSGFFRTLRQEP